MSTKEKASVEDVNRLANALIFILQRHEDEIYRLTVLNQALLEALRKCTDIDRSTLLHAFSDALDHAKQTTPPQTHTDLGKEVFEALRPDPDLEQQLKTQH